MKILVTILAFINGAYMLIDGIFVLLKGKYIGTPKPGPWASVFYKMNVDVFKLGPLFVVSGLLWLTWLYALWRQHNWAYALGIFISVATLWYLPIGTVFSLIILLVLLLAKNKLGLS